MNVRRIGIELCWLTVTLIVILAYGALLTWIDSRRGLGASPALAALLLVGAGALVVGIVLVVLALSIEREQRRERERRDSRLDLDQSRDGKGV